MDNVTHALAGLLMAEGTVALVRRRTPPVATPAFRRTALVLGLVAAELPDADLVYSGAMLGIGKLGYLLHHRGHTHVLLAALPLGLLAFLLAGCLRFAPRWREIPRAAWGYAAALAVLGVCLHVAADGMNSYGIHPFWPLWNGWLYGDAVFIVEPLFWATAGVFVASRARGPVLRYLPWVLLAAGVALGVRMGVLTPLAMCLLGGTAVASALAFRYRFRLPAASSRAAGSSHEAGSSHPAVAGIDKRSALLALVVVACVIGVFFAGSRIAHAIARGALLALGDAKGERVTVHDVVVDPLPSNPVCWAFLSVETIEGAGRATYRARAGRISLFPSFVGVEDCPARSGDGLPAETPPEDARRSGGVLVESSWSMPLSDLVARADDCRIAAWLRFVRVPYFVGEQAHDLRYSRRGWRAFSTFDPAAEPSGCPPNVPDWIPPRQDIFGAERFTRG